MLYADLLVKEEIHELEVFEIILNVSKQNRKQYNLYNNLSSQFQQL